MMSQFKTKKPLPNSLKKAGLQQHGRLRNFLTKQEEYEEKYSPSNLFLVAMVVILASISIGKASPFMVILTFVLIIVLLLFDRRRTLRKDASGMVV